MKMMLKDPEVESFKIYLDFDSIEKIFFYNLFFIESNFALKIELTHLFRKDVEEDKIKQNIKYEKFELTKYVYILHFE
ncbi:hypothetical protein LCGC14_3025880 [marine sediment metagenome]|uniref:Uncharacterized protein n=1 Tax=marine sediment metagenome TaxID=412755 RepID=A0A0F8Z1G5_9ZZZZ